MKDEVIKKARAKNLKKLKKSETVTISKAEYASLKQSEELLKMIIPLGPTEIANTYRERLRKQDGNFGFH